MTGSEALAKLIATGARVETAPDTDRVAAFLATVPADAPCEQLTNLADRLISEVARGFYHWGKSVSLATQAAIADALLDH